MNNNKDNKDRVRMSAHEQRVNRALIRKAIVALTVIMTVIGRNISAVIEWVKQLKSCNDSQKLTLKGLFCTIIGEAAIYGMPTATRNLLLGMGAPSAIVALTNNRKVIWLLNYIEDSYSSINVKQLLTLSGQAAVIGATLEDEVTKQSYLPLHELGEMSDEEVENM